MLTQLAEAVTTIYYPRAVVAGWVGGWVGGLNEAGAGLSLAITED